MVPVSLTVPQFSSDPAPLHDLARTAHDYGLKRIFFFDHLVPLKDARRPVLEAVSSMGAAAALTTVSVGSLVLRVTLRPPEVSSAVAATLEAIAPGRVVIGLGVGDSMSADEGERFGQELPPLEERLQLLIKTIEAIRVVAPAVPVWVGGRHRQVREVAARLADGWNAWGAAVDEFEIEASEVREAVGGRPFTISWGGTLLLAPDEVSLRRQVTERGGTEGAIAGTPSAIRLRLEEISTVADELVISVVPNRSPSWELLSRSVLAGETGS